jgi:hypothetical protein
MCSVGERVEQPQPNTIDATRRRGGGDGKGCRVAEMM